MKWILSEADCPKPQPETLVVVARRSSGTSESLFGQQQDGWRYDIAFYDSAKHSWRVAATSPDWGPVVAWSPIVAPINVAPQSG